MDPDIIVNPEQISLLVSRLQTAATEAEHVAREARAALALAEFTSDAPEKLDQVATNYRLTANALVLASTDYETASTTETFAVTSDLDPGSASTHLDILQSAELESTTEPGFAASEQTNGRTNLLDQVLETDQSTGLASAGLNANGDLIEQDINGSTFENNIKVLDSPEDADSGSSRFQTYGEEDDSSVSGQGGPSSSGGGENNVGNGSENGSSNESASTRGGAESAKAEGAETGETNGEKGRATERNDDTDDEAETGETNSSDPVGLDSPANPAEGTQKTEASAVETQKTGSADGPVSTSSGAGGYTSDTTGVSQAGEVTETTTRGQRTEGTVTVGDGDASVTGSVQVDRGTVDQKTQGVNTETNATGTEKSIEADVDLDTKGVDVNVGVEHTQKDLTGETTTEHPDGDRTERQFEEQTSQTTVDGSAKVGPEGRNVGIEGSHQQSQTEGSYTQQNPDGSTTNGEYNEDSSTSEGKATAEVGAKTDSVEAKVSGEVGVKHDHVEREEIQTDPQEPEKQTRVTTEETTTSITGGVEGAIKADVPEGLDQGLEGEISGELSLDEPVSTTKTTTTVEEINGTPTGNGSRVEQHVDPTETSEKQTATTDDDYTNTERSDGILNDNVSHEHEEYDENGDLARSTTTEIDRGVTETTVDRTTVEFHEDGSATSTHTEHNEGLTEDKTVEQTVHTTPDGHSVSRTTTTVDGPFSEPQTTTEVESSYDETDYDPSYGPQQPGETNTTETEVETNETEAEADKTEATETDETEAETEDAKTETREKSDHAKETDPDGHYDDDGNYNSGDGEVSAYGPGEHQDWNDGNLDNDSSGGGGGGGSVICTYFYQDGDMSRVNWVADHRFAQQRLSEQTVRGYHTWGIPAVRLMRSNSLAGKAIKPAMRYIALHRSDEVAYQMGRSQTPSLRGKIIRRTLEPLCWTIGAFVGKQDWRSLYKTPPPTIQP